MSRFNFQLLAIRPPTNIPVQDSFRATKPVLCKDLHTAKCPEHPDTQIRKQAGGPLPHAAMCPSKLQYAEALRHNI